MAAPCFLSRLRVLRRPLCGGQVCGLRALDPRDTRLVPTEQRCGAQWAAQRGRGSRKKRNVRLTRAFPSLYFLSVFFRLVLLSRPHSLERRLLSHGPRGIVRDNGPMRMKRDERRAKQHALAHPINHRHRPSLSGKAQWPLLITGAGRSGTLFTAVFLNNLGMKLSHDNKCVCFHACKLDDPKSFLPGASRARSRADVIAHLLACAPARRGCVLACGCKVKYLPLWPSRRRRSRDPHLQLPPPNPFFTPATLRFDPLTGQARPAAGPMRDGAVSWVYAFADQRCDSASSVRDPSAPGQHPAITPRTRWSPSPHSYPKWAGDLQGGRFAKVFLQTRHPLKARLRHLLCSQRAVRALPARRSAAHPRTPSR